MKDCLEFFGDIVAVFPVADGTLSYDVPFNIDVDSLRASAIRIDNAGNDVLSMRFFNSHRGFVVSNYNNENIDSVTIETGATVKESGKKSVAGIYYETKVSFNTFESIKDIRSFVNDIKRFRYFDLFIVDAMDRVFLLRGIDGACAISMSANLPISQRTSIEIEYASVNGVIPVSFD